MLGVVQVLVLTCKVCLQVRRAGAMRVTEAMVFADTLSVYRPGCGYLVSKGEEKRWRIVVLGGCRRG